MVLGDSLLDWTGPQEQLDSNPWVIAPSNWLIFLRANPSPLPFAYANKNARKIVVNDLAGLRG